MADHRVTRQADADVHQVLAPDGRGNVDEDIAIRAVEPRGAWGCECGAGPFESKASAKRHLVDGE